MVAIDPLRVCASRLEGLLLAMGESPQKFESLLRLLDYYEQDFVAFVKNHKGEIDEMVQGGISLIDAMLVEAIFVALGLEGIDPETARKIALNTTIDDDEVVIRHHSDVATKINRILAGVETRSTEFVAKYGIEAYM